MREVCGLHLKSQKMVKAEFSRQEVRDRERTAFTLAFARETFKEVNFELLLY